MAKFLFTNFGSAQLGAHLAETDGVLELVADQGDLFPLPDTERNERFALVARAVDGTPEVLHCWQRDGDFLNVLRGQEGTQPQEWPVETWVSLRTTADALNNWASGQIGALAVDYAHYFDVASLTVSVDHVFAGEAERDTYFAANPDELVDEVAIRMGDEWFVYDLAATSWVGVNPRDNYFLLFPDELVAGMAVWLDGGLQVFDENENAWRDITLLMRGPRGPVGDSAIPVEAARDAALVDISDATQLAYDARDTALAAADFQGVWSELTGALAGGNVAHAGHFWMLLMPLTGDPGDAVEDHEPGVSAKWQQIPDLRFKRFAYADRGDLRSLEELYAVVDGLGFFSWVEGSDEIDDDETCFATVGGRWLLEAVSMEAAAAYFIPPAQLVARFDAPATYLGTLQGADLIVPVPGAAPGDSVLATPSGPLESGNGRVTHHAYVQGPGVVVIRLGNPSAQNIWAAANSWTLIIFKAT